MLRKSLAILFAIFAINAQAEKMYKPYTLGVENTKSVTEMKAEMKTALRANGFTVVGQYMPAADANRWVMVVTHKNLTSAVQTVGGLTGFASTLRVAITKEGATTKVSYTTPEYWARAYFTEDFSKVEKNILVVTKAFTAVFAKMPGVKNLPFGSKKGLDADDLEDYNYMMGMPDFDDTEELGEFNSHADAVNKIDANLKKGVPNVKLVYKYKVPGKNLTLYGFALSGEDGEKSFLPTIDLGSPKHTAFLPYEVLVKDGEVHMLHGRFRIAIAFPDLSMGTFTKIMSTPGDIEDMLEGLVK